MNEPPNPKPQPVPTALPTTAAKLLKYDSRVNLAVEPTSLAEVRTGLATMGFGFVLVWFGVCLPAITTINPEELAAQK